MAASFVTKVDHEERRIRGPYGYSQLCYEFVATHHDLCDPRKDMADAMRAKADELDSPSKPPAKSELSIAVKFDADAFIKSFREAFAKVLDEAVAK